MSTTVAVDGKHPLSAVRLWAATDPGRPAVVGDEGDLGYAELWRLAQEHAVALGDRPGVVPVPAVHEPRTVVALLGCWASGGTYCPIDPGFPAEHAESMLAALAGQPLDDPAYVLFTSGSTGRPKPVAVPHRALDAVVPALVDLFGIGPDDRVLQYASLSWDTSLEELLPTLVAGASVVFDRDAHSGCFPLFLRAVERRGVTVLDLPTAVWHELVLHLAESGEPMPTRVRLVVIGGEPVDPTRLAAWRGLPGSDRIRLLNTYGATETALITHAVDLHGPRVPPTRAVADDSVPIGRPLDHVRQHLSEDGELLVAGPHLADGYPGCPDATLARFVRVDGVRWFRTGDVVRPGQDGLLHHAGRLDDQVKVRGVRVDPGEVEAHLRQNPDVAAAAVAGVRASGRTVLEAYVVPNGPAAIGADLVADLRAFLRARAPSHLWPSRITLVPELALTRSGKVDRRATQDRYRPSTSNTQEAAR
jgi:non-ribosomal peptide synthetase component F